MAAQNPAYAGLTATYIGNDQCQLSNGTTIPVIINGLMVFEPSDSFINVVMMVFRPGGGYERFLCGKTSCSDLDHSGATLTITSSGYSYGATNGDVEYYDTNGLLTSIVSIDGYTQNFDYNPDDTLQSVVDNHNRSIEFFYTDGLLTSVNLPDGTSITYGYNGASQLNKVTYSDNSVVQYEYDDANYPKAMTSEIDESNNTYAVWQYDDATGFGTFNGLAGPTAGTYVATDSLQFNVGNTVDTDSLGTQRTYNYQDLVGDSRLTSITGPVCRHCTGNTMTYDANGYLASVRDWDNNETDYTFGGTGLLDTLVEGKGTAVQRTTKTTWDTVHRVPTERTVLDASNNVLSDVQWQRNARGEPLARCEIDPSNAAASGYVCSSTGSVPAGVRRWTYTYCDTVDTTQCPLVGLLLSVTGPRTDLTQITTYSYYLTSSALNCGAASAACYQVGDLHQVTDALGHVTTIVSYDGAGRVVTSQDANGVYTDYSYTLRGWLHSKIIRVTSDNSPSSLDAVSTIGYTPYGAVNSVTDPDGVVYTFKYDSAHRLTDIYDALNKHIHYTLDAAGNKTGEQWFRAAGALVRSVSSNYNALGELTSVVDGLSQTVFNANYSDSYDPNGNLTHSVDGRGIQHQQGFDALNRLHTAIADYNGTDPSTSNATTTVNLDALDQVTSVVDPTSLTTTYQYDGLGDRRQLQSPDTGTSTDTYNAAGDRLVHTDAKGVTRTSTYDALDRLSGTSYLDSSLDVSYHYDEANTVTGCTQSRPIGRLTRVVEAGVTTVYCYGGHGNLSQKRQITSGHTDITSYTYTSADRLSSIVEPDGTAIVYTRGNNGDISQVQVTPAGNSTAPPTVVSGISYWPFGPISAYTLGNGQTVTRSYDANYRLSDIVSPTLNLHYARDPMGDIQSEGGGSPLPEAYQYDALYRLTTTTYYGSLLETDGYNKAGDRLNKSAAGLATGAYAYTPGTHQLASIAGVAFANDANGNTTGSVIGATPYGFGYNGRNRLTLAQVNQQTVGTYTYNAWGQRIGKVTGATTERYAYDQANHLIGEYGTATNRDYVWVDDLPVAVIDNTINGSVTTSTVNYIIADGLNTPRRVMNAAGTTIWSWAVLGNPFGEQLPTSSTGYVLNLRYPGQYYDAETGTNYNLFRTYEPAMGRYLQSDPIGLMGGISTYAYVGGDPLDAIDSLGLYDVVVAIWRANYFDGSVGHVATFSSDGTALTSQFPTPHSYEGANTTLDWQETLAKEGRGPDDIYNVHLPDEDEGAIEMAALGQRSRSTWDWLPTNKHQTNCTTAAIAVLGSVGIQAYPNYDYPPMTPHDVNSALGDLSNQQGSNVTRLSNVPW